MAAPNSAARAVMTDVSMRHSPGDLREGEDNHGRGPGAAKESRDDTGGGRHILLVAELVADHAATDRAPGVEAIKRLAVAHVDDQKVVVQVAGEQHAS